MDNSFISFMYNMKMVIIKLLHMVCPCFFEYSVNLSPTLHLDTPFIPSVSSNLSSNSSRNDHTIDIDQSRHSSISTVCTEVNELQQEHYISEPLNEDKEKYDEIYKNLSVVASLKKGEKIAVYNNTIIVDGSYAPYLSRWWFKQSGLSCITFIEQQIIFSIPLKKYKGIYDKLQESKSGLNNLKTTYINRSNIVEKINDILERISMITFTTPPF
jgi:hypothetical protein